VGAVVADGVAVAVAVGGATLAWQRPLTRSHVSTPLVAFPSSQSALLRQAITNAPRPNVKANGRRTVG
jgi:hypothetical protein